MRKTLVFIIPLIVVVLQGCILRSVHPFYKESDLGHNQPSFDGNWKDKEGVRWRIHQNVFKPGSMEMHCSKNGREASLLGHLFTLNGDLYLDAIPLSEDVEELLVFDLHMVPTHSIARVEIVSNDEVNIRWFNEEWLSRMFTQNKIKISHETIMDPNPDKKDDGMYLLTASTDELQKFIIKYGKDEEVFGDNELSLNLKRIAP